jgi:protease IV
MNVARGRPRREVIRAQPWIAGSLVLIAWASCAGQKDRSLEIDGGVAKQTEAESPGPGGALGPLRAFSSLLSVRAAEPGPYAEPRQSANWRPGADHVAVIDLAVEVVELAGFELLGGRQQVELRVLVDRIADLAADDQVAGLLLRLDGLAIAPAPAQELRDALAAFRKSAAASRQVWCYADELSDSQYAVAAACDSIGMAVSGRVSLSGAAATPVHLKRLLDQVGVTADFVHIGAFKGAAEPLTRDQPSPQSVQSLRAIVDQFYGSLVTAISAGRRLPEARVEALIDRSLFTAAAASEAGLIDQVASFAEYRDQQLEQRPWRVVRVAGAAEPDLQAVIDFLGLAPRSRPRGPHVALVYAVGAIVDRTGSGGLGLRSQIAARPLVAALRALARDPSVKAVVLRVNSPGGSALASALIWQAVAELRQQKPVIVSMGAVAASGGYYIGCGATRIFAQPDTLTGSIGVVGGKLVIDRALRRLGVSAHPLHRGQRALMWSAFAPWSADERAAVREMMQATYQTFVGHVAEGRGLPRDRVDSFAQGRVWTGAAARERGLVDEFGGLARALATAHELGQVAPGTELEIYPPEPTLADVLGSLVAVRGPLHLSAAVIEAVGALGPGLGQVTARTWQQLQLFRAAPVQAVLLLPLVSEAGVPVW